MKLYIVRHGEALPKYINPARSLSEDGRIKIERLATLLKPLRLSVAEIWHSGKERARQTAEILSSAVTSQKEAKSIDGLDPDDSIDPILDKIMNLRDDLMIVGHLPFVDKLTRALLVGKQVNEILSFPTGGIACLEQSLGDDWHLLWFLNPELLGD